MRQNALALAIVVLFFPTERAAAEEPPSLQEVREHLLAAEAAFEDVEMDWHIHVRLAEERPAELENIDVHRVRKGGVVFTRDHRVSPWANREGTYDSQAFTLDAPTRYATVTRGIDGIDGAPLMWNADDPSRLVADQSLREHRSGSSPPDPVEYALGSKSVRLSSLIERALQDGTMDTWTVTTDGPLVRLDRGPQANSAGYSIVWWLDPRKGWMTTHQMTRNAEDRVYTDTTVTLEGDEQGRPFPARVVEVEHTGRNLELVRSTITATTNSLARPGHTEAPNLSWLKLEDDKFVIEQMPPQAGELFIYAGGEFVPEPQFHDALVPTENLEDYDAKQGRNPVLSRGSPSFHSLARGSRLPRRALFITFGTLAATFLILGAALGLKHYSSKGNMIRST